MKRNSVDYLKASSSVTNLRIDILIAQRAGDVLQKIPSVYNRLSEGDPEAVSHAQTSCRRIIDAFADAVYPPTDEAIDADFSVS